MKKLQKIIFSTILLGILSSNNLLAHTFWVNSFESFSHQPGHTTVSLGWGHAIPIDDILNSVNGRIIVNEFTITNPRGDVTKLRVPSNKVEEPKKKTINFDIFSADIALQKIALRKNSQEGVYKIEAKSKPTIYTKYLDTKDRERLKLTSMDKIKDIKKVFMSVKYEASAKSYLSIGKKWTIPKASNKGLEIIPKTDLSNVKVGDMLEFEVLFFGKPVSISASSMEYITAMSSTFGQNDGFSLMSYIQDGKAQFRVQNKGQWIVGCNHKEDVTKEGSLKNLYGKVNQVYHGSSLTFNVK